MVTLCCSVLLPASVLLLHCARLRLWLCERREAVDATRRRPRRTVTASAGKKASRRDQARLLLARSCTQHSSTEINACTSSCPCNHKVFAIAVP